MARDEALYSTGRVMIEKSADTAIIAIPTQKSAGKVLIVRIPRIMTHVEKREVALPFKNVADALPDLAREVAPRGVVGAGVHENEGRLLERFERGDERLGRGVARRAVVVRIGGDLKARRLQNGDVVPPSGIGHDGALEAEEVVREARGDSKRPGAAQGLDGRDASVEARGRGFSENESLNEVAVDGEPFDREVAVSKAAFGKALLGLFNHFEKRDLPGFVEENADAQIHLPFARVGLKHLIDAHDGIVGHRGERMKKVLSHDEALQ